MHASAARVHVSDMAIVLQLLTLAVPEDDNAFSIGGCFKVARTCQIIE